MQPVQHIDATRDYKQLMAKATQLWLDKIDAGHFHRDWVL